MKNCFVHFFCKNNYGDDLFVILLAKRFPDVRFHVHGKKEYLKIFQSIDNIKCHVDKYVVKKINGLFRRMSGIDVLYKYRTDCCDTIIYIGGSVYIQPADNKLEEYNTGNRRMRVANKPFMLVGANFGPYTKKEFYEFYKEEFSHYDLISFRDKDSYDLFDGLNNRQVAPDIIFDLKREYHYLINKDKNEKYIAISIIGAGGAQTDGSYLEKISQLISRYCIEGYGVKLISLCEIQGDSLLCEQIAKATDCNVEIVKYKNNIEEVISCIINAEYVIGSRFHAIVTALAFDIPVLPVAYSKKTTNMLSDIGYKGKVIDINVLEDLTYDIAEENRVCSNGVNAKKLAEESRKHFDAVSKLL